MKQLRRYNQFFNENGYMEFRDFYTDILRKGRLHLNKMLVEDKVIMRLNYTLRRNFNFKEEITEDNTFKIAYQIGDKL